MRLVISFFVVAFIALVLTACNSAEWKDARTTPVATAPAGSAPSDGIRRVTVPELQDLLAKNQAVVIDVRNQASFNVGHIRGAKLIPEAEVANRVDELPKNKLVVTYCSCSKEQTAIRAVADLKAKGFDSAAALLGGFPAWQSAGLPVDTDTATP